MSERNQSFAAIQSLMNNNEMHKNTVANIDQLRDNYSQQTDEESNKATQDISDAFGTVITAKSLEGTADKLKKKLIAKTGDFIGEKVEQAAEKQGLVKTAQFVNRLRSGGINKAVGGAISDAKELAENTAKQALEDGKAAVGDAVEEAGGAARQLGQGAIEHLGEQGRNIIDMFRRGVNANMDAIHDALNPFKALSGDAQRALQEGGGGSGAADIEAQLNKLAGAAVDNSDIDAGVAGEAEGAAAMPEQIVNNVLGHGAAQAVEEGAAQAVEGGAADAIHAAEPVAADVLDGAADAAKGAASAAADAVAGLGEAGAESGIVAGGEAATAALGAVDAVDQEIPGLDVVTDLATLAVGGATLIAGQLFKTHSSEEAQQVQDAQDKAQDAGPNVGYEMGDK
tara:strand:- start:8082 stop:9275 length:1194 start_codon:yes stop_codon:yes gene_type:complete